MIKPTLAIGGLMSVASLALAACGSSGSGSSSSASNASASSSASSATVRTASVPAAGGTVLVDSSGMTLYHLGGEAPGRFICTGSCMVVWHPLTVSSGATPSGVSALGIVRRPEGTMQVTYKGEPLYTFASDKPGQASGQGLKDVGTWSAVAVGSSGTGTSSTSTGGSGETGSYSRSY